MARSTRSRRGEGISEMQDDPEVIIRARRQGGRAGNRRMPHGRTGSLSLPQTQGAAPPEDDTSGLSTQDDAQTRDPSEANDTNSDGEEEATATGDVGQGNAASPQHSAHADAENATDRSGDEANDASGSRQNQARPFQEADASNEGSAAGSEVGNGSEAMASGVQSGRNGAPDSTEADGPAATMNEQANAAGNPDPSDEDNGDSEAGPPRQDSPGAGPVGTQSPEEQPALTACERFRASLKVFKRYRDESGTRDLDRDLTIRPGNDLPLDAINHAVASVTEAISERGDVLFSVVDRFNQNQRAARPGETLLWPFHRARPGTTGGHFSLLILETNDALQVTVSHRDSYHPMRPAPTLVDQWRALRPALAQGGRSHGRNR